MTKLLTQPDDGIQPLLQGLRNAKKSIDILVFRFDRSEVEKELVAAVQRGVQVHALIAFTNRGEEKNLRKLESRLLERGITVGRTADDLVRYHGKMFIIDRKQLYLLAFNFTFLDINLSRSFALIIDDAKLVADALRLFEADSCRKPFVPADPRLIVSPLNARKGLTNFIMGAKKQLLIYEMKLSDHEFVHMLNAKIAAGVEVRILGKASVTSSLPTRNLSRRLHARCILRDAKSVFLGSQSLRKLEMEARREIGVILHDEPVTRKMIRTFETDWHSSTPAAQSTHDVMLDVPAKKVARAVARQVSLGGMVEHALDKMMDHISDTSDMKFEPDEMSRTIHRAFREEIHDAVVEAVREMVAHPQHDSNAHQDSRHEPASTGHPPAAKKVHGKVTERKTRG